MSVGASDFLTDEELEELGEDGLSHFTFVSDSDKKVRKKKTLSKPPLSPRSPYLTGVSLNPRRSVASAWRAALSQSPMKGDYELPQSRAAMSASTPEYLKEAFGMKKPRHSRSASNGYTPGTPDFKEKEDMYDEILELKKILQAQKVDSDRMKAKLRRLEEENTKKEKQIEQLLDPTKGPEYTRSLVDKKVEGKSVVHGLKQKVLRLEQQCREKEAALSKLQSELRTTNMEEMKITMETYYEEVQRLRVLLESTEKSNKQEGTENRRQQKVLRAMVLKLTKSTKQLEEENVRLKEEAEQEISIVTESPANRARGYVEWSKQRLVRRLLDLEKRLEEVRNRHVAKDSTTREATEDSHLVTKATRPEDNTNMATVSPAREMVSVSTETDESLSTAGDGGGEPRQERVRLKGMARRLREERSALQESLSRKDEELRQRTAEREEAERILSERTAEHESQTQCYREEIQSLSAKITDLQTQLEQEQKLRHVHDGSQEEPSSSSAPLAANEEEKNRRQQAARTIQKHWQAHRIKSALRSHLCRHKQLLILKKQASAPHSNNTQSGQSQDGPGVRRASASREGLDEEEVILLQSVFRGHLKRHILTADRVTAEGEAGAPLAAVKRTPLPRPPPSSLSSSSSSSSVTPAAVVAPPPSAIHTPAIQHSSRPGPEGAAESEEEEEEEEIEEEIAEEDADVDYSSHNALSKPLKIPVEQAGESCDSDDSDDIIVSPSRPSARRMSLLF